MKTQLTYKAAFDELQTILEEIDSEQVQVDALTEKINRASELIDFCQTKLRSTEDEFKKTFEKLRNKL